MVTDSDEIQNPVVSAALLVWNRPASTALTTASFLRSTGNFVPVVQLFVLNQNSKSITSFLLKNVVGVKERSTVFFSSVNSGIAGGWRKLLSQLDGDYIVFLENDWFCDAEDERFILDALEILRAHDNCAFVKLRALRDKNDFGWGDSSHAPWSVPGHEHLYETMTTSSGAGYYLADSARSPFTFNPILARKSFVEEIKPYLIDNLDWQNPLRSGEEAPSKYWRRQNRWVSATLHDGPFRHTGFYSVADKLFTFPKYALREFTRYVSRP